MARRRRSPQEKKRLSLALDNLSTTGESPHALRKNWKKKKRGAERARRTAERVALETRPDDFAPVRRRTVRKWGYKPLGDALVDKLKKRADQTPRKSAAARERRRLRRGSKRRAKTA